MKIHEKLYHLFLMVLFVSIVTLPITIFVIGWGALLLPLGVFVLTFGWGLVCILLGSDPRFLIK